MMNYAKYSQELDRANGTEIFVLTGCLSKCDKYSYTAQARDDLQIIDCKHPENTLDITFGFPSGLHEIREQVTSQNQKLEED